MSFGPLLIVIAASLWALDGLIRSSLYGLPPSTLIFFEHILGFLIIAPFAMRTYRQAHFTKKEKSSIFTVSLLSGVIGTLLFTMALGAVGFIPFSVAILIQKFQPIFAIGLAMILGKEQIPKLSYIFIGLALIAGYFVTFPHGISMTSDGQKQVFAALYALGAAAAWGTSTNFSKYLLNNHHPEVITMLRFALTTCIIAVGLVLIPEWRMSFRVPTQTEWMYLGFIAGSTGLVAMYIYYHGLQSTPVHVSAILELTWPIIAVAIDYFYNHQLFTLSQFIAMAILICSMYMVSLLSRGKKSDEIELHSTITP